ncbi:MAG: dephospho-CoA kinase [Phycisphaeraceae bacterium]|nr:dephospho-CoA kinase [Phycisphaeraceae bacterium]
MTAGGFERLPAPGAAPHEGERVLLALRPHPVTILLRSWFAVAILILYLAVLAPMVRRASGATVSFSLLWAAILVAVVRVGVEVVRWYGRRYILTDRRVISNDGVFQRWRAEVPLARVQSIAQHRTLVERLLGLGTVGVSSASALALESVWISIAKPDAAMRAIRAASDQRKGEATDPHSPPAFPQRTRPEEAPTPDHPPRPLVIGLVGGIGAGKSQVARHLLVYGAVISDSDARAKEMLDRPDVRATLQKWWGDGVLDDAGRVDRRALAAIVFADPEQRTRLEELIHPLLREGREALKRQAAAEGTPIVVIDAPLLLEAGIDDECDEVWFVDAPRDVRLTRVRDSRNWDEGELARREAAQMPLDQKLARAHRIIPNDDDECTLASRVEAAARAALAAHTSRSSTSRASADAPASVAKRPGDGSAPPTSSGLA